MHRFIAAAVMTAAGVASAANIELPPDMPTPTPGLWKTEISMPAMGGMSMNAVNCVGGIEEMLRHPELDTSQCTDIRIEHENGRITTHATCKIEHSTAHVSSVFTGDFEKSYQGEIHTTYTPPLQGMHETTVNMQSRWVAAQCLPGQKPGDAKMQGGVNVPGIGNIDLDALMKNIPGRQ